MIGDLWTNSLFLFIFLNNREKLDFMLNFRNAGNTWMFSAAAHGAKTPTTTHLSVYNNSKLNGSFIQCEPVCQGCVSRCSVPLRLSSEVCLEAGATDS